MVNMDTVLLFVHIHNALVGEEEVHGVLHHQVDQLEHHHGDVQQLLRHTMLQVDRQEHHQYVGHVSQHRGPLVDCQITNCSK